MILTRAKRNEFLHLMMTMILSIKKRKIPLVFLYLFLFSPTSSLLMRNHASFCLQPHRTIDNDDAFNNHYFQTHINRNHIEERTLQKLSSQMTNPTRMNIQHSIYSLKSLDSHRWNSSPSNFTTKNTKERTLQEEDETKASIVTQNVNVTTLWTYTIGYWIESSAAVMDIDGDGKLEVVVGSFDNKTHAINGEDGSLLWTYTMERGAGSSPAVADIDNDGKLEVIINSFDNKTHAINGEDGSLLWTYTTKSSITSSPAVADLDGDGKLEVVATSFDGNVYVVNGEDGSLLWTYFIGFWVFYSSPTIADLDGDGKLEIVIGSLDGNVSTINGEDGSLLWTYTTGDSVVSSPAVADLDGDNKLEIIVGTDDNKVYAVNGEDGSLLWTYTTGDYVRSSPAVADLDGDGKLEVVIGSADNKTHAVNGEDGSPLWTYTTGGSVVSSPAVADLDGDGKLEVVIGSADNKTHVIDISTTGFRVYWPGYSHIKDFPRTRNLLDIDPDMDFLSTASESILGTSATNFDTDADGMPDGWEYLMELNATNPADASQDKDGDGMPNLWEYQMGFNATNPTDADLDDDGDGLSNLDEYKLGLDPKNSDTDGDGTNDGDEVRDPLLDPKNPLLSRFTVTVIIPLIILISIGTSGVLGHRWIEHRRRVRHRLKLFREEGRKLGFSGKSMDVYVHLRDKGKIMLLHDENRTNLPESSWLAQDKNGLSLLGAWFVERYGNVEVVSLRQVVRELGLSVEVVRSEIQRLISAGKLEGNVYGTVYALLSRDKLLDVLQEASDRFDRLVTGRSQLEPLSEEDLLEVKELGQLLEALSEAGRFLGISMLEEMANKKRADLHRWLEKR